MDGVQRSQIFSNTLKDNHAKGISLYKINSAEGSTDNIVHGNTVVMAADAKGYALVIKDGSTGAAVKENTLLSPAGAINMSADSLAGLKSDQNKVTDRFSTDDETTTLTLDQWRKATGQDANSTAANAATRPGRRDMIDKVIRRAASAP